MLPAAVRVLLALAQRAPGHPLGPLYHREFLSIVSERESFGGRTLERLVTCLVTHSSAQWIRDLHYRYLDFSRLPG